MGIGRDSHCGEARIEAEREQKPSDNANHFQTLSANLSFPAMMMRMEYEAGRALPVRRPH
jgi:hypothetical protein